MMSNLLIDSLPPNKTVTLVLVEDDDVDAMSVVRAFRKVRIANPVCRVKDGVEALSILRDPAGPLKETPFVLLVDINMPRMNGIELLQKIREDPNLKQTVAFMFTTSKREEDKFAAYNLNVAGYILKDRSGEDFLKMISLLDHYWRVVELPSA